MKNKNLIEKKAEHLEFLKKSYTETLNKLCGDCPPKNGVPEFKEKGNEIFKYFSGLIHLINNKNKNVELEKAVKKINSEIKKIGEDKKISSQLNYAMIVANKLGAVQESLNGLKVYGTNDQSIASMTAQYDYANRFNNELDSDRFREKLKEKYPYYMESRRFSRSRCARRVNSAFDLIVVFFKKLLSSIKKSKVASQNNRTEVVLDLDHDLEKSEQKGHNWIVPLYVYQHNNNTLNYLQSERMLSLLDTNTIERIVEKDSEPNREETLDAHFVYFKQAVESLLKNDCLTKETLNILLSVEVYGCENSSFSVKMSNAIIEHNKSIKNNRLIENLLPMASLKKHKEPRSIVKEIPDIIDEMDKAIKNNEFTENLLSIDSLKKYKNPLGIVKNIPYIIKKMSVENPIKEIGAILPYLEPLEKEKQINSIGCGILTLQRENISLQDYIPKLLDLSDDMLSEFKQISEGIVQLHQLINKLGKDAQHSMIIKNYYINKIFNSKRPENIIPAIEYLFEKKGITLFEAKNYPAENIEVILQHKYPQLAAESIHMLEEKNLLTEETLNMIKEARSPKQYTRLIMIMHQNKISLKELDKEMSDRLLGDKGEKLENIVDILEVLTHYGLCNKATSSALMKNNEASYGKLASYANSFKMVRKKYMNTNSQGKNDLVKKMLLKILKAPLGNITTLEIALAKLFGSNIALTNNHMRILTSEDFDFKYARDIDLIFRAMEKKGIILTEDRVKLLIESKKLTKIASEAYNFLNFTYQISNFSEEYLDKSLQDDELIKQLLMNQLQAIEDNVSNDEINIDENEKTKIPNGMKESLTEEKFKEFKEERDQIFKCIISLKVPRKKDASHNELKEEDLPDDQLKKDNPYYKPVHIEGESASYDIAILRQWLEISLKSALSSTILTSKSTISFGFSSGQYENYKNLCDKFMPRNTISMHANKNSLYGNNKSEYNAFPTQNCPKAHDKDGIKKVSMQ